MKNQGYKKQIEKPRVKCLKTIDLLSELPFYKELNVMKTNHPFRGYAMSYKVKLVETEDAIKQKQENQVLKNCLRIF